MVSGTRKSSVQYGPHTFSGGPEFYIKTDISTNPSRVAHKNIQQTLIHAFSNTNANSVVKQLADKVGFERNTAKPIELDFINYGAMQLVYLASITTLEGIERFTVLINQPITPLGKVKSEFENLQSLAAIDSRFVIEPLAYFKEGNHELFVTPYINDAICVANRSDSSEGKELGFYDPRPKYHFESFSSDSVQAAHASMIALLVKYYDDKLERGIGETRINGSDFILTRDFDRSDPSTILPNMRLIAARGFVEASLDDYLVLLRQEFSQGTHYDNWDVRHGRFLINHKSKIPLTSRAIDAGIALGLELRSERVI